MKMSSSFQVRKIKFKLSGQKLNLIFKYPGKTTSKLPSTAIYSSTWIKYDPRLHKINPEFKISVTEGKEFSMFTLRPMVCDWLSHCSDVQLRASPLVFRSNSVPFSFKFPELKNTGYFRYVFNVDYFKPQNSPDNTEETIEFEIELEHLGDPCNVGNYADLCNGRGGDCVSDPKVDAPNELNCKCEPDYEDGQFCANNNFCNAENGSGVSVIQNYRTGIEKIIVIKSIE
jgi:hypothetical protein